VITARAIEGLGEIERGADLAALIVAAGADLQEGDVVVIAHKAVSKAEGAVRLLSDVRPGARAHELATEQARDPRLVQVILDQSRSLIRATHGVLICETTHGFICANAGVDLSNVEAGTAALLPVDPDRSARRIRESLAHRLGVDLAVVVSDTFGRTWRNGVTDVAIGIAGIAGVVDLRGTPDATGRVLEATEVCIADEVAGAAELVMGKDRSVPAAVVRGVDPSWLRRGSVVAEIVRDPAGDLFR